MDDELNCPNCGAPRHGGECEFCGTRFGGSDIRIDVKCDVDETLIRDWTGEVVMKIRREGA